MPDHTVLQDTAERYRLLVDSITDYAIYMLDADGRVVSWNPGAQRFKGYAPAEIIGEHFSRFYTPEDRAAGVPARALATARNEGRFEAEGWRVRKSGDRFWAHVVIDPIRDSSGALVGYAKITRDLTERRMAEEAVRKSEQLFKLLVQGVTDYAIYLLDREGHVSSWNAGARRIKGYEQDEIIGEHFSRFYTEEDRAQDAPRKALATAAAEGRFEKEGWRVRKNGERFFAHVVIDPIRDGSGAIIGFAKITRDITERREAQERLDEARQALLQAQKLDAIGQLTGGIAHDFNNLLMANVQCIRRVTASAIDDLLRTKVAALADVPGDDLEHRQFKGIVARVEVHPSDVRLLVRLNPICRDGASLADLQRRLAPDERLQRESLDQRLARLELPVRIKLRGGRTWHSGPNGSTLTMPEPPDRKLAERVQKAHQILVSCGAEPEGSRSKLFRAKAPKTAAATRAARWAFLAPDLQRSIFSGHAPSGGSWAADLELPLLWSEQRALFSGKPQGAPRRLRSTPAGFEEAVSIPSVN